jgi:Uri superfamily endonuclease
MLVFTDNIDEIPAVSGAYVLVLEISKKLGLTIPRFRGVTVMPGLYAYAGSARGPGGIQARCRRHLRKSKKLHWHVDHLTSQARRIQVAAVVDGNECDLRASLQAQTPCEFPVPGFGSSDCPHCPSHLLLLKDPVALSHITCNSHDIV